MTNKPMLSVERELLEDFADYADKGKVAEPYMAQKLRALIDKSAFVDACPDAGLIPAELVALLRADLRESIEAAKLWLASNANGAPVEEGHLGCVATAIEMLRLGDSRDQIAGDFLDKTAAQHQGEPVAWVKCSPAWLKSGGDCATAPRICVGREGISHLHPAHSSAEQPASAAVVMPERESFDIDDWAGSFCQEALQGGISQHVFERCIRTTIQRTLAEVARLNGVKT